MTVQVTLRHFAFFLKLPQIDKLQLVPETGTTLLPLSLPYFSHSLSFFTLLSSRSISLSFVSKSPRRLIQFGTMKLAGKKSTQVAAFRLPLPAPS